MPSGSPQGMLLIERIFYPLKKKKKSKSWLTKGSCWCFILQRIQLYTRRQGPLLGVGVCEAPFLSSPVVVSPVVPIVPLTEAAVPVLLRELFCILSLFTFKHRCVRWADSPSELISLDTHGLGAKQTASPHQANTKQYLPCRRDGKFLVAVESYTSRDWMGSGRWCDPVLTMTSHSI